MHFYASVIFYSQFAPTRPFRARSEYYTSRWKLVAEKKTVNIDSDEFNLSETLGCDEKCFPTLEDGIRAIIVQMITTWTRGPIDGYHIAHAILFYKRERNWSLLYRGMMHLYLLSSKWMTLYVFKPCWNLKWPNYIHSELRYHFDFCPLNKWKTLVVRIIKKVKVTAFFHSVCIWNDTWPLFLF